MTGQLGTQNSKLESIQLGSGSSGSGGGPQFAGDNCSARDQISPTGSASDSATAIDKAVSGSSGVANSSCLARDNCSVYIILVASAADASVAQNTDTVTPGSLGLADNANARDSALNAKPTGNLSDKATTHDRASASTSNIGSGRYDR